MSRARFSGSSLAAVIGSSFSAAGTRGERNPSKGLREIHGTVLPAHVIEHETADIRPLAEYAGATMEVVVIELIGRAITASYRASQR